MLSWYMVIEEIVRLIIIFVLVLMQHLLLLWEKILLHLMCLIVLVLPLDLVEVLIFRYWIVSLFLIYVMHELNLQ